MTIVLPGVCRYSVLGTYAGQDCVNIVDMQIDTTGGGMSRETAIFNIAGDILNNWTDHVLPGICPPYVAEAVAWVDLDSADGVTGQRSSTSNETWPMEATGNGPALPGNTAIKVIKECEGGRRTRNGRMFLAGVSEGDTGTGPEANRFAAAAAAATTGRLADFLDGINDTEGVVVGYQRKMVVIHNASGTAPSYSDVTALVASRELGTMRRRMPGYGT